MKRYVMLYLPVWKMVVFNISIFCVTFFKIYSRLLVTSWQSSGKSRFKQKIKAIYPSVLQMLCAVLIGVIFCSLIIIIIIIIIIPFMHGIYTYIPDTNCVPTEYSVAAILLLLFMVLIPSVSVFNLLHFYISTF